MLRLRMLVSSADAVDVVGEREAAAGEAGETVAQAAATCRSRVLPGSRLVVAIAPEFTIGFVLPSLLRSTAASESNGSPVPSTPTRLAHLLGTERLAHEREHERLRDAHDA